MKNKGCLPIPFLILILAGVVSLFSLIATSTSRAGMVRDHSPQVQMMEQQRMAAVYFRILSWLSDVTPRPAEHAKSNPQPAVPGRAWHLRIPPRTIAQSNFARFLPRKILRPSITAPVI